MGVADIEEEEAELLKVFGQMGHSLHMHFFICKTKKKKGPLLELKFQGGLQ